MTAEAVARTVAYVMTSRSRPYGSDESTFERAFEVRLLVARVAVLACLQELLRDIPIEDVHSQLARVVTRWSSHQLHDVALSFL